MTKSHETIIIGAGVIGASIAWHLQNMGAKDVTILEKELHPGSGSTCKANGGIRAQFTTEVNIKMSLLSMNILDEWEQDIGDPPVYHRAGYLFITADESRFNDFKKAVEFQRGLGVSVSLLDKKEVIAMAPYINSEDIIGGTFGADDGFVDPGGLCNWLLRRAGAGGTALKYETEVVNITRLANGTFHLETSKGNYQAEKIINCAGPYCSHVAAMLGIDIPVQPVRRQLMLTGKTKDLPAVIPMVIDADTGVLIRREGDAVLVAYADPEEPPGFNMTFDDEFIYTFAEAYQHRFPEIADLGIDFKNSWAGLYSETPDHHAILGEVAGVEGFYLANGFSGHGVMHSPAVGKCMAELVLNGSCSALDISPLSLDRFEKNQLIHETMVL